MPLLRYDIGDVVRVAETRDCACGLRSDGPLLERVEGRLGDCAEVDGETVTPLMLDDAIHAALGPTSTHRAVAARRRHAAGRRSGRCAERRARCRGRRRAARNAAYAASTSAAIAPEASGKYRLVKR